MSARNDPRPQDKPTGGGPGTNMDRVINAQPMVAGPLPTDARAQRLVRNVWGH